MPMPISTSNRSGTQVVRWLLVVLLVLGGGSSVSAFTAADQNTMISSYNSAFYYTASGSRGYFRNTTDAGSGAVWFWGRANEMEMILDVYERTTNSVYLTQFTNLYNGFVYDYGTGWSWNEYNDDIMWAVIACSRAYLLTGNTTFRTTAKNNFDACYARAWSSDLGGGLWWKYPTNTSKNACVNGPAAIAAYLLYKSLNDTNYLTKANDIFLWEKATLVDPSTGRVYDSIYYTGSKDTTPITYNSGTYIGAANFLGYTNEAMLAANYVKSSLTSGGILPQYDEDNDLGGFNGIFLRWMAKFMKDRNLQSTFQNWLQQNADAAWNVRRPADNLSWSKWKQQTPGGIRYSFGCWGSVLALQIVPPTQTNNAGTVSLIASDASGTSSFESGLNWAGSVSPSYQNNFLVANGLVLRTPQDNLHHNFAGNSLIISNATLAIKSSISGRVITVGTELILDNGVVSDWAGVSEELAGKITLRSGGGVFEPQLFPVFTISAFIGGSGALRIEAPSAQVGGTVVLAGYNTYGGGTVINSANTLQLSGQGSLGSTNAPFSIVNTAGRGFGTLNLNGIDLTVGNLSGTGGKIWNNASSTTNTLTIGSGDATGGIFQGTLVTGAGTLALEKIGSGIITFTGSNSYTGGTIISGGTLQLGDGASRNGYITGAVTNKGQIIFANPSAQNFTGNISGNGSLTKSGAGILRLIGTNSFTGGTLVSAGSLWLGDGAGGNGILVGNVTNNAAVFLANSAAQTFSGVISGSGSVSKVGAGTFTLTASNSYLGNTFVNSGGLALSGAGQLAGTPKIALASGTTLNVSGRSDQTLALNSGQTLTGSGTVIGSLNALANSTLKPGDSIGTLTIQGNTIVAGALEMELNRDNAPNSDQLSCSGNLVTYGTLFVQNTGATLQPGDSFQLFNKAVDGFSSVTLPQLEQGLGWSNRLSMDGSIQVIPIVSTAPISMVSVVSGTNLTLSWPQDHIGWRLQVQTNSLVNGLGTNWTDVTGSSETNEISIPIIATAESVFFRLTYP